ncbi:hypothetical protein BBI00_07635 [Chryseobacterium arthrosphaerae]|uniref:Uncharacterized protein n=2 Tax=Chryseobacterium arthrosphaerae TaxID=651561 RepID=A0A1B8ZRK6_9FLAO|nr:hypothetical protein BBI00_07635 [Chryseobacterium arthrosphaerae]
MVPKLKVTLSEKMEIVKLIIMETVVSGKMTPAYATHEVGHSLGLKHKDDENNTINRSEIKTSNLMSRPQWEISKQTISEQKQIIIQNIPDEKNKN